MVLMSDGSTEHADRQQVFVYQFQFDTAVDVNKCLKQVKLSNSLYTSASLYELQSDEYTMIILQFIG